MAEAKDERQEESTSGEGLSYADLYMLSRGKECKLGDLRIEGAKGGWLWDDATGKFSLFPYWPTSEGLIRRTLERYVDTSDKRRTFGQLVDDVYHGVQRLSMLHVDGHPLLKDVNVSFTANADDPTAADCVIGLKENNRYRFNVGTTADVSNFTSELEASARFKAYNALGYGEGFRIDWSRGNVNEGTVSATYMNPRFLGTDEEFSVDLFRESHNFMQPSSYREHQTGLRLRWMNETKDHQVQYWLAVRELMCSKARGGAKEEETPALANWASREIQEQAGYHTLSSVKHIYTRDRREDARITTGGYTVRVTTELAGLGGDPRLQKFFKEHVQCDANIPLPSQNGSGWNASLFLSLQGGLLVPLGEAEARSYIGDRFFLGGQNSLRGFAVKGAGPSAPQRGSRGEGARDALGGDVMVAGLAALRFDIPFASWARELGIYGQLFCNVGSIMAFTGFSDLNADVRTLRKEARTSIGVGLVLPLDKQGSVELNYCRVRKSLHHDKWRHGVHFGFSV